MPQKGINVLKSHKCQINLNEPSEINCTWQLSNILAEATARVELMSTSRKGYLLVDYMVYLKLQTIRSSSCLRTGSS